MGFDLRNLLYKAHDASQYATEKCLFPICFLFDNTVDKFLRFVIQDIEMRPQAETGRDWHAKRARGFP